ncbi:MAG: phage tail protein I [Oscillospiraceae bacterium]|nr:phage tail protein I [Oscillospiraceae bacterium]
MSKLITDKQSLLDAFPYALLRDEQKALLADVIAEELIKLIREINKATIYTRIDELPEELLDILAYDFKVDWYDTEAPIENKRKAIKECFMVHKYKGTKYAVETALHSMFEDAKVEEWFEYGGEPYHFKLTVYGGSSGGGLKNLYLKVQYAKNLRSVMDDTVFIIIPDKAADIFVGTTRAAQSKRICAKISYNDDTVFTRTVSICAAVKHCAMSKRLFAKVIYNND